MGEVEDDHLRDAGIGDEICDLEGIGRPVRRRSDGGAGFEVEAEEDFFGIELRDPAGEIFRIGERFEGEDKMGGTATEETAGLIEIADSHVDVELESVGNEPAERLPMGNFSHETIEVGDVEAFQAEVVPDGAGDVERAGRVDDF